MILLANADAAPCSAGILGTVGEWRDPALDLRRWPSWRRLLACAGQADSLPTGFANNIILAGKPARGQVAGKDAGSTWDGLLAGGPARGQVAGKSDTVGERGYHGQLHCPSRHRS